MSAGTLLASAQAAGVHLSLDGNKVKVEADHEPPAELIESLWAHKGELLAALKAQQPLPPGVADAYTRLGHALAGTPGLKFACETLPDEGGDHILMAVAVRGAGYAVLRMPRAKFDGFKLIEMVERWNHEVRLK